MGELPAGFGAKLLDQAVEQRRTIIVAPESASWVRGTIACRGDARAKAGRSAAVSPANESSAAQYNCRLMRLFTGLDLPAEAVHNLEAFVARLKPAAHIHWSPPANLHITTKFIGEFADSRLAELQAALATLPERPAIEVTVGKVGFYPNERSPRVFWCGVEAPGLDALAAQTDSATALLGVARENRPYSPHLTLARIKDRPDLRSSSGASRRGLSFCIEASCVPPVPCTLNLRSFPSQSDDHSSGGGNRLRAGCNPIWIFTG
jgi:2'-5' RNA ligase